MKSACLAGLSGLLATVALAQPAHYPGAWYDAPGSQASGGAVYFSNDRLDRVESFYRQFLTPLPAAGGSHLFCQDPVTTPDMCRRFVELQGPGAAGVGTRIRVFQR
jgi:hypothetical protein